MIERDVARAAGLELCRRLAPACERIEIAGSIRRGKPMVKDLELVAVPRIEALAGGLFGDLTDHLDHLELALAEARDADWLLPRIVEIHRASGEVELGRRLGGRYQALVFEGVPVDLFIVRPPAEWGVVYAIRTGPAAFSERLVTDARRRLMRVEKGGLFRLGQPIACPEEADFFRELGEPWVEPEGRA